MTGVGRKGRAGRVGSSEGPLFWPAILADLLQSRTMGTTEKETEEGATETADSATRISASVGGCKAVTTAKVSAAESFFSIGLNLRQ